MDKRLQKRHKRQVARAKAKSKVNVSLPDVRTPEQLREAREASRPAGGWTAGGNAAYGGGAVRGRSGPATEGAAKVDG